MLVPISLLAAAMPTAEGPKTPGADFMDARTLKLRMQWPIRPEGKRLGASPSGRTEIKELLS